MAEPSKPYVIGIDLGGTNARAVVARMDGSLGQERSAPSQSAGPPEGTFDVLASCVNGVLADAGIKRDAVAAIGMGLPGIITGGECVWSPNFPLWRNVPIREMLECRTSLPCHFLNDARCATLAEHHFGAGKGVSSMVFVGLGTGIGGGIVLDGRLLLGRNGSVGEIAHHTIDPNGPRCSCGNFGCWEAFCGRDYIIERAVRKMQMGRESSLRAAPEAGRALTPRIIADAARNGDALAGEVMGEVGYYLGVGVANLVNMLNPERVVIGGGVAQAGELIFAPIRRTVQSRAVPFQAAGVEIIPARLGSDAGLQGAVALALVRLGILTESV